MLQQAKSEGLTIKVRHAKIWFCGASCAGKTSFSRLLRCKEHKKVYVSTPAGDSQQVLLSGEKVNVEGTNWRSLDSKSETEELTKRLIQSLQGQRKITVDERQLNINPNTNFDIPAPENKPLTVEPHVTNIQPDTQTVSNVQPNSQTVRNGQPSNQTVSNKYQPSNQTSPQIVEDTHTNIVNASSERLTATHHQK